MPKKYQSKYEEFRVSTVGDRVAEFHGGMFSTDDAAVVAALERSDRFNVDFWEFQGDKVAEVVQPLAPTPAAEASPVTTQEEKPAPKRGK